MAVLGVLCRVFLASTGLLEGFLVAKGVSEEMPAAREVAARRPRGLPPPQNARLMWGSEPLPRSHCGGKGEKLPWAPSGLIHPTRFPNQHVAAWVPLHTGAKRLKVKKLNALKLLPYTWRQCFNLKPRPFWLVSLLLASLTAAAFVRPDPQIYSPVASLRRLTTGHLTFTVPRKVK